jgi:hypothetical protein
MDLYTIATIFEALAILEKEELPEDSDDLKIILRNIQKIQTYTARKKYAERNLKHLSSGSSRIVYLTKEKTVIKLAKNERGDAQNKAEATPKKKSKYINKILSHASNYSWIQTPFLKKMTVKQFKKMTGIDFDDFGEAIHYALRTIASDKMKEPDCYEDIKDIEFFKEIVEVGKKNDLMPGDLSRTSSWLTDGDHPILGDAGLTKKIFKKYYK